MEIQKKLDIFKKILSLGTIWGRMEPVEFLSNIWNLHLMTSDDPRFKDAHGDAIQHLQNNDDWDDEYTFLTRFSLHKSSDDTFYKFLNTVVSPEVRETKDEILRYVNEINGSLEGTQCKLSRVATRNKLPVFCVGENNMGETWPEDIDPNHIPFFYKKDVNIYPAFALHGSSWDDYSHKTSFELIFYKNDKERISFGKVKIMHKVAESTANVLDENFTLLSSDFCSLGQNLDYYRAIKANFPHSYKSILYALRDAAYFTVIADVFQQTIAFQKSLLRDRLAFEAFRKAYCMLENIDLNQRYNFIVKCKIPYCNEEYIPIEFKFGNLDNQTNIDRIKALIGENGSGKSSVLYSLAKALNENDVKYFEDNKKPYFSKTIAISYSIFDRFHQFASRSSYNFIYCGLRDDRNSLFSDNDTIARFHLSLASIEEKNRIHDFAKTLEKIMNDECLDSIFGARYNNIDQERFDAVKKKMSSGQSMMTNIITELYAHIRENSLILFDEPEVHLHPKGITNLVKIIYNICEEFNSACILATHSSVVLQELLARNVIVIERESENSVLVRPMNTETLGENLTTITDDVFGRSEISSHYSEFVHQLIHKGYDIEQISSTLKTQGLPMSLNLYMYIRQQLKAEEK